MLYDNILSELYGEDREEAVGAIDNDAAFDRWLVRFEQQRKHDARGTGKKVVDKQTYLDKYAKVIGGDDDG